MLEPRWKKSLVVSHKIKQTHSPTIPPEKMKTCPHHDLYTNVSFSFFHNAVSQKQPKVHQQVNG